MSLSAIGGAILWSLLSTGFQQPPPETSHAESAVASEVTTGQQQETDNTAELSDQTQRLLGELVNQHPIVVHATVEKGAYTGSMFVHQVVVHDHYRGANHRIQSVFAHKWAQADPLPMVRGNTDSLPVLPPGDYVMLLDANPITNSIDTTSFSGIGVRGPSFNYVIPRFQEGHAAWPFDSPEARFVVSRVASQVGSDPNDPRDDGDGEDNTAMRELTDGE